MQRPQSRAAQLGELPTRVELPTAGPAGCGLRAAAGPAGCGLPAVGSSRAANLYLSRPATRSQGPASVQPGSAHHMAGRRPPDTARVVIHVDVDCFYAQVEENRNPALRGKPLAVTQKYLCVTTNYAARARGVAKMMGLKDALATCPELQLVSGEDLTPYRAASKQILAVLAEFGTVERLGMDEAVVDATSAVAQAVQRSGSSGAAAAATPSWRGHVFRGSGEQLEAESYRRPMDLRDTGAARDSSGAGAAAVPRDAAEARLAHGSVVAEALRRAVRERVGYACCCGIAHNKLLAKISCGLHKPDNQTSVRAPFPRFGRRDSYAAALLASCLCS